MRVVVVLLILAAIGVGAYLVMSRSPESPSQIAVLTYLRPGESVWFSREGTFTASREAVYYGYFPLRHGDGPISQHITYAWSDGKTSVGCFGGAHKMSNGAVPLYKSTYGIPNGAVQPVKIVCEGQTFGCKVVSKAELGMFIVKNAEVSE